MTGGLGDLPNWVQDYHPELVVRVASIGLLVAAVGRWALPGARRWRAFALVPLIVALQMHYRAVAIEVGLFVVVSTVLAALVGRRREWTDAAPIAPLSWISLIGVWAAVPDTEPALIGGLVMGLAVLGRAVRTVSLVDRLAVVALIVGSAWDGSAGKTQLVGGLGCIGLLAVPRSWFDDRSLRWPAWPRSWPAMTALGSRWPWWQWLVFHGAVVLVCSRVITRGGWRPAVVSLLVLALGVSALIRPRPNRSGVAEGPG